VCSTHNSTSVEGDNPVEKRSCRNYSTAPTGHLTGSCRCSPQQEVKSFHFKAYSFLVDGALE